MDTVIGEDIENEDVRKSKGSHQGNVEPVGQKDTIRETA